MIREATLDDIPALLSIGQAFHKAAGLDRLAPLDLATLDQTLTNLIRNENGVVFMDGQGGATGGLVHPCWFNAGHITGQELFWWAPNGGRALFDALEAWARERAHSWTMITLEALRPDAVGAIYRRRGYHPTEHSYVKVF